MIVEIITYLGVGCLSLGLGIWWSEEFINPIIRKYKLKQRKE